MRYYIEDTELTRIADAVRKLRYENNQMTPLVMAQKINELELGVPYDIDLHIHSDTGSHWVRPQEYPDLDAIQMDEDFDGVYLTYDLRKTPGYSFIGLYGTLNDTSKKVYIERGHLDSNNEFVVDESHEVASNAIYRSPLDTTNGNIQLWRVWSDGGIRVLKFRSSSTATNTGRSGMAQPCVERVGQLPNIIGINSSYNASYADRYHSTANYDYIQWGTQWLERDAVALGGAIATTSAQAAYNGCFRLQEVDMSRWNTSAWTITSLSSFFRKCYCLRYVDMSGLDTSNWAITNMTSVFAFCYSLKSINMSGWDVTNWAVTTLGSLFYECLSLREIDWTGWDTTNWPVTALTNVFYNCYALRDVDVSVWNTQNWRVNNMTYMFYQCLSLQAIDFSGWDTSNWVVTNLSYMFSSNRCLRNLDLSVWDTSNWAVTTLAYMFQNMYGLKTLNVDWDTSNWAVTTLAYTFNTIPSITELDLSSWNTSNWKVTNLSYAFSGLTSCEEIDFTGWDTSGWAVTNLSYMFNSDRSLKTIDLRHFDTSNWAVTTMAYMFNTCTSLEVIDISTWDSTKWNLTVITAFIASCFCLQEVRMSAIPYNGSANNNRYTNFPTNYCITRFDGFQMGVAHAYCDSYTGAFLLTPESLVSIFNRLKTVSSATTITIGRQNILKLTSEQLAIATNKGWTVA